MKKRVLVTGAGGFVGSHLVPALIKEGYEAIPFNRADGDIQSAGFTHEQVSHVIHLAGLTFVPQSWEGPKEFYRVNVMGCANVLEFCRRQKCGITFASTYVYGPPQYLPIDETHPIAPNTPYNHSKYLAEQLCRFYHDAFSLDVTILRPFNIFGHGQAKHFLLPEIIGQLLDPSKKEISLMSLTPRRDYLYIADFVGALTRALEHSGGFHVYNIGSGKSFSVLEICRLAMMKAGIQKDIVSRGGERQNEVMDIVADVKKARVELGWQPEWAMDVGLEQMIQLWKRNLKQ